MRIVPQSQPAGADSDRGREDSDRDQADHAADTDDAGTRAPATPTSPGSATPRVPPVATAGGRPHPPKEDRFPDVVEIVVEIPRGSRNKYEWDERADVIRLDRVLSSSVFYNFDYAFVTDTLAEDGDHTDALLLIDEPTFPGCHVAARPVGGLAMSDEHGFDFKVLCVAVGDPFFRDVISLEQMEPDRLREIENFFATYKLLEDKQVDIVGWQTVERAREVLVVDRARFTRERATNGR